MTSRRDIALSRRRFVGYLSTMDSSSAAPFGRRPWLLLWFTALVSLVAQLALCQFFTFGDRVPLSIDVDPSNLWKYAYHFPPTGEFLTLNWLGLPNLPPTLNPFSLAAATFSTWLFFTAYAPLVGTCALLAMAAFLRELELPRPAALFGGVIFAWQGDLLPFVFPGHYAYITTWPFFALGAWGALRAQRTGHWAWSLVAGACCGMMVGLQPDRGGMASLLVAFLYLAPALTKRAAWPATLRQLTLCAGLALLVSLAALLALFQSYIVGVKLGASSDREFTFALATQFSLGPLETLTYLVPGFFGWHSSNAGGPYWGWIGQTPGWQATHEGTRNLNLAVSTTGTVATTLALLGAWLLLPEGFLASVQRRAQATAKFLRLTRFASGEEIAPALFSERQVFFARVLLLLGAIALVLSWGYHTPFYRPLFALPLMDKWRDPLKWLEITNFALVTLAALGVQCLTRSLDPNGRPLRGPLQLFFALMTGLFGLALLLSWPLDLPLSASLDASGYEGPAIANIVSTLHAALAFACTLTALSWLALAGAWRAEWLRRGTIVNPWLQAQWRKMLAPEHLPATFAVVLALLGAVQLRWVAQAFIEPTSLARLTASNDLLESLTEEGPQVRVAVPAPQDPILNYYLQNQFAADHISSVDISAASRIPDDLNAFLGAFEGHPARLWLLAGVKNVAVAQGAVARLHQDPELAAHMTGANGYTLAEADTGNGQPTHALVQLKDSLAKATFVPNAEIISDDTALLKRLVDPAWNPRGSVLLSTAPTFARTTANQPATTPATVDVPVYTPNQIRVEITAPSAGYLLINDKFDPDWEATVNGARTPLLRADYLLRALPVAAGKSEIVLRYVAHYRVAGLRIPVVAMNLFSDGVMLAAWIVAGVALGWRRRTSSEERTV
jgi:hypothetical protein